MIRRIMRINYGLRGAIGWYQSSMDGRTWPRFVRPGMYDINPAVYFDWRKFARPNVTASHRQNQVAAVTGRTKLLNCYLCNTTILWLLLWQKFYCCARPRGGENKNCPESIPRNGIKYYFLILTNILGRFFFVLALLLCEYFGRVDNFAGYFLGKIFAQHFRRRRRSKANAVQI